MNANDARIVRLFTAQVDGTVEDNTPNAKARVPFQFDLILQAEVGDILGDSGANYTLTFAAINDDMVARQVSLNPEGNPFKEEWNADRLDQERQRLRQDRPRRGRRHHALRIAILPA